MTNRAPLFLKALSIDIRSGDLDLKRIKQKCVFILSTGRTGTQFLAKYYNNLPDVLALHEPKPSRRLRFWTVAYLEGFVDEKSMQDILKRFRSKAFKSMKESTYIESNNFMSGFAESIKSTFDKPIIIHVTRDPRTYIQSAINKGAVSGLKGLSNRYFPYSHFNMDVTSTNPIIERSARYWFEVNTCLAKSGIDYENYHMFRYEDLFSQRGNEINKLSKLLGFDPNDKHLSTLDKHKKINESPTNRMESWKFWNKSDCRIVNEICGELMKEYKYGMEKAWKIKTE